MALHRRNLIILAAVLLILTSVCRIPISDNVRFSFQFLFQVSTAILLAYAIWFFGNKWLSALLVLATVSCFYPRLTGNSFVTFQLIVFAAAWYLIIVYALKPRYVSILLDAMCIIALCHVAYQMFQICGYDFIYRARGNVGNTVRTVGLMSNRNELAALLSFCLPAFFRKGWVWLIPLMIVGFFNTHVMGGILAGFVALGVFLIRYLHRWIWVSIAVLVVLFGLYCVFLDFHIDLSRLTAWSLMWDLYKHNWLFGFGIGSFQTIFYTPELRQFFIAPFAQAHNDIFQGVFEMGIGFAVIFIGYLISVRKKAIIPLAALGAIVVNSLVNFPFHIAITAMIAVTWMAILEVQLNDKTRST